MADSAVLTKAKSLLSYDASELNEKLAACEAPALELFEHNINDADFATYHAISSGGNITGFAKQSDYATTVYCANFSDVQYLQNGSKITIASTSYAGTYKIRFIDLSAKTFEIQVIFTISEAGTFTNARKTQLEYAAAYFLLYSLVMQAQEIKDKKVLASSSQWGEGNTNQAQLNEKIALATEYKSKAYQYLNYNYSQVL